MQSQILLYITAEVPEKCRSKVSKECQQMYRYSSRSGEMDMEDFCSRCWARTSSTSSTTTSVLSNDHVVASLKVSAHWRSAPAATIELQDPSRDMREGCRWCCLFCEGHPGFSSALCGSDCAGYDREEVCTAAIGCEWSKSKSLGIIRDVLFITCRCCTPMSLT